MITNMLFANDALTKIVLTICVIEDKFIMTEIVIFINKIVQDI